MSGFQKVALGIGLLAALAALAGLAGLASLAQKHYFQHQGFRKEEKNSLPQPIYGGHLIEANWIRLYVPVGYFSKISPNGQQVEMATEPGNFSEHMFAEENGRIGRMYFWREDERAGNTGDLHTRELMTGPFRAKSFGHFADRPYSLSGQDGICSEYRNQRYDGKLTYGNRVGVACTFGADARASFEGTLLSADDFYHVIESAQPLKGKTD